MIKKYLFQLIFLIAFASTAVAVGAAAAQAPTPSDDQVNAVARGLYCPVCENIPLDVCPTQACAQWRDLIRQMLAQGKTPDEIKQYFVTNYGDRVLATPPARGFNWLVYILPPVLFLLGVLILFSAFRSWRASASAQPAQNSPPQAANNTDEYIRRLEEELRKR